MTSGNIASYDSAASVHSPWGEFEQGVESTAKGTYNFINEFNPLPALGRLGSDVYSDIKGLGSNIYDDIKGIDYKDYYASGPASTTLRDAMQSSEILPVTNYLGRYDQDTYKWGSNWSDNTPIIDYNSLYYVVLLLVILILAHYLLK